MFSSPAENIRLPHHHKPARSTIGIIGTAGRKDDGPRMSRAVYDRMADAARAVIRVRGSGPTTHLVSGGAAWADHIAVRMALEGVIDPKHLTLHLPAALEQRGFSEAERDGGVANYYHHLFSTRANIDSISELHKVIAQGAIVRVSTTGFIARDTEIARNTSVLLAFTFGTGEPWKARVYGDVTSATANLKKGGTQGTWDKCRATTKIHVTLAPLE